jgi:hypothetical protein
MTITVTEGSPYITGGDFGVDDYYRTIKIDGDSIENQPMGINELLHPYGGASGQVSAILYGDAVSIPKFYAELVSQSLKNLDTGTFVTHSAAWSEGHKSVCRPEFFVVEANAINRSPECPSVIRFNTLPDRNYRLQGVFSAAPLRVSFSDLLAPGIDLPIREEWVESCLFPISRGLLTSCRLWRSEAIKSQVRDSANEAERRIAEIYPTTLATPNNRVGTPIGF